MFFTNLIEKIKQFFKIQEPDRKPITLKEHIKTEEKITAKEVVKTQKAIAKTAKLKAKAMKKGPKGDMWIDWAEDGPRMKTRGYYLLSTLLGLPQMIMFHHTAGRSSAVATMKGGIKRGLAYMCIDRGNGKLYQGMPLNKWGYHAGKSFLRYLGKALTSLSKYALGVEVCSAGKLSGLVNGRKVSLHTESRLRDYMKDANAKFWPWYAFDDNNRLRSGAKPIADNEVRVIFKKHHNQQVGPYQMFTKEQEETMIKLCVWYAGVKPDFDPMTDITSHDIVSPDRKNDVGGCLSCSIPEFRLIVKKAIADSVN